MPQPTTAPLRPLLLLLHHHQQLFFIIAFKSLGWKCADAPSEPSVEPDVDIYARALRDIRSGLIFIGVNFIFATVCTLDDNENPAVVTAAADKKEEMLN